MPAMQIIQSGLSWARSTFPSLVSFVPPVWTPVVLGIPFVFTLLFLQCLLIPLMDVNKFAVQVAAKTSFLSLSLALSLLPLLVSAALILIRKGLDVEAIVLSSLEAGSGNDTIFQSLALSLVHVVAWLLAWRLLVICRDTRALAKDCKKLKAELGIDSQDDMKRVAEELHKRANEEKEREKKRAAAESAPSAPPPKAVLRPDTQKVEIL
jgi:hypothetical protein